MRRESIISLDPGRDAVILEARVRDMRRLLDLLPPDGAEVDWLDLIRTRVPDILALLEGCVRLPDGATLDELTLTDAQRLLSAWWEMHQGFFVQALAAAGLEAVIAGEPMTSTAPRSH